VAGYCFGGVVALEIAHQLAAIGQEVAMLILLNTPVPQFFLRQSGAGPRPRPARENESFSARLSKYLSSFREPNGRVRWASVPDRIANSVLYRFRPLRRVFHTALRLPMPDFVRDQYFLGAHHVAEIAYRPRPTTSPMAMFLGKGIYEDAPEAWRRLAQGPFEQELIPGNHFFGERTLLKEPAVSLLADRLEACLNRRPAAQAHTPQSQRVGTR
jgi:thioesterase domain-containing protein